MKKWGRRVKEERETLEEERVKKRGHVEGGEREREPPTYNKEQ